MSDTAVMFFMSIPFLIIFVVGCHSLYLYSLVSDERTARAKEGQRMMVAGEDEDREGLLHEPLLMQP